MSLATRCPACGTIFRVVPDQLRVSEGWVRCGRCAEVFNGAEHLVELDALAAAAARSATAPAAAGPQPETLLEDEPAHAGREEFATADPGTSTDSFEGDTATGAMPPPPDAPEGDLRPDDELPDAGGSPGVDAERPLDEAVGERETPPAPAPVAPAAIALDGSRIEPTLEPPSPAAAAAPTVPAFVSRVERAERWRRPAVRRALAASLLLLAALLCLQMTVEYRDLAAARWPALRPGLEALCRWSDCRVEPPRWIEALVVDSSGLVRVEGTNTYRLSVVVRNRAAMQIAAPSVDLQLTDTQGRTIVRRALSASDLGSTSATVPALAELALQATIAVAERQVAGYTIEIFYP